MADQVSNISGALVKAVLIASADFMSGSLPITTTSIGINYRFNNEQGYGRIQLDNALPLETSPPSASVRQEIISCSAFVWLGGMCSPYCSR